MIQAETERNVEQRAAELIACAREHLGLNSDRTWKLISTHGKFSKIFFEIEESSASGKRSLIGKCSDSKQAQGAYNILTTLWNEGMRPPARHTVVEPIAYLPEQYLLIQEKAPGVSALDIVKPAGFANRENVAQRAAEWLHALQQTCCTPDAAPAVTSILERCVPELSAAIPRQSETLRACGRNLLDRISAADSKPRIPSHGDYHPMNVFVADGRTSAIDVDTYAGRNPVYDAAYFLAESAIFGFHATNRLSASEDLRGEFLEEFGRLRGAAPNYADLAAYVALAFLRSLHFDLCILRTGNAALIEPYMGVICRSLESNRPVIADE